ncbi:MAG: hypothetical protein KAQ98_13050 [Bacteriovoracaceae bacterium]|nr:hypothetical protein [Bacteriovoracaceae bacterium]
MRVLTLTILSLFVITTFAIAKSKQIKNLQDIPMSNSSIKEIKKHRIISSTTVSGTTEKIGDKKIKKQILDLSIAGLHKRTCNHAIPKLFHYEDYKNQIGIVKMSSYNDKTGKIYILLEAPILKTHFVMSFKIPRIKKTGLYHFTFDRGFLKGLVGEIHVSSTGNKCLIFTKAHWKGKKSAFPNLIFELFVKTASKMAMTKLFRISGSRVD